MSEKRPLVLWSGGTDSTAMVIDLLHKSDIDILYVNLENNKFQQRQEKKSILKIRALLADANLKGSIRNVYEFGYTTIAVTKAVYAQPSLWLQAAAFVSNTDLHSSVNLGYVRQDDAWHFKTEIYNLWDSLNAIISEEKVPLEFPYEWHRKQELINDMKQFVYYKQIMSLIYWCESGTKRSCGECDSCKRHKSDLG
jgi:7-cyano-7-deazaguanine synthase in queuosine biosynthesis